MASVRLNNVRKIYRRDTQQVSVLENVSLEITAGDYVALMGPSGSGKTTLLNLIGGIDQPTSGDVFVGEKNIARLDSGALAKWRSRNIPIRVGRSWIGCARRTIRTLPARG